MPTTHMRADTSPAEEAQAISHDAAELARPLIARNGALLRQRAIRADDAPRLQAFHLRLSREAIIFRYFGAMSELSDELAQRLSHVDYENHMAVVLTLGVGVDERIIAVARYQREGPESAEIAFTVEDPWQGQGLGHTLLWTLALYARQRGFVTLIARMLFENERMFALLRHSGFPVVFGACDERIEARLDIRDLDTPVMLP